MYTFSLLILCVKCCYCYLSTRDEWKDMVDKKQGGSSTLADWEKNMNDVRILLSKESFLIKCIDTITHGFISLE